MEMIRIKETARKRRQKLLQEKNKTGWTDSKLALKYNVSRARIGQLLKIAKKEYVSR